MRTIIPLCLCGHNKEQHRDRVGFCELLDCKDCLLFRPKKPVCGQCGYTPCRCESEFTNGPGASNRTNPKDLMGVRKVPLISVIPPASFIYEGLAMRYGALLAPKADGSLGYGAYNWRKNDVVASIYADAALRHILMWWDGEANAPDSNAPHLGHAKACLGILADAIEGKNLVDDRPPPGSCAALLEFWKESFA